MRVFDFGETQHGDPFIVMEVLEGARRSTQPPRLWFADALVRAAADRDRDGSGDPAGDLVGGAGIAAAGAGVVVLIVQLTSAKPPRAARIVPWVTGHEAGVLARF